MNISKYKVILFSILVSTGFFVLSGCNIPANTEISNINDSKTVSEGESSMNNSSNISNSSEISTLEETSSILIDDSIIEASLVNEGNLSRMLNVMKRASHGETITIGFIGGSITEGSSASNLRKTYSGHVRKWFEEKFPQSGIEYVNAGIGATGSLIGVHRMDNDLLSQSPDLVIVEFAVNDARDDISQEAYEGVVRKILSQPNNPAVILLFMMDQNGNSSQRYQERVGENYNLPMISYKDAIQMQFANSQLKWTDISPDHIHPNDLGHYMAAEYIIYFLESTYNKIDTIIDESFNLPDALTKNRFMNAKFHTNKTFNPLYLGGFTGKENLYRVFGSGWIANQSNEPFVFETDSKVVTILYKKMINFSGGKASVSVDGKLVTTLNADFVNGWGDYADYSIIINEDTNKNRKVEISFINNDAGSINNTEFVILAILES